MKSITVPFGSYTNCWQTEDYSPLEPETTELKYYAAGVGFILETKPGTSERVELVQFSTP